MPIILSEIVQGSPEWFAAKAGSVGASQIDKIITNVKGERVADKTRGKYLLQVAGERITGKCEETYQSKDMANGTEREPSARALFELVQGVEVQQVGIVFRDEWKLAHCSPDGLVGNNAGFEVKNPKMATHVQYLLDGKMPTDYIAQVQFSLYVTERDKWHFMSCYEGLPPLIIEVGRDEAYLKKLADELDAFNCEMLAIVERLKKLQ